MWYPASVDAPSPEPLSIGQAKSHLRIDGMDEDALLNSLIAAARSHLENACALRFARRTNVTLKCDAFADLARLPEAPVASVASISYVDTDGASQTLSTSVYELRADGVEAAIVLKTGQQWPAVQPGSRITVTATIGYDTPPAEIVLAMSMLVAHFYDNRSAVNVGNITSELPFTVNALICNHRRGV
jgi:uncharacterized phiE125 gp8 family phage protein